MKKIFLCAALAFSTLMSACTSETQYGSCIGAFDDKDPALRYHASSKNLILAIIFSETVIVPVVVIVDETTCPVGKK